MSWSNPHSVKMRNPVSRSQGRSIVAKAAYNAREKLHDERTDTAKNHSRNAHEVEFKGMFVDPSRKKVPTWTSDRGKLWNCVEAGENRKDSQLGQEIIAALPHQLSPEGRANVVKDFTREFVRGTGRIADAAIHKPPKKGDDRNYHAHILFTMRGIGPDGFESKKLPVITTADIDKLDEKFALRAARELRREGFTQEADRWAVGHLSKPEQLKDALRRGDFEHAAWAEMEPTKHLGPAAIGMDRREPGSSDLLNAERDRKAAEMERLKLAREMKDRAKTITALEKEITQDHTTRPTTARETSGPHIEQPTPTPKARPKPQERETPEEAQRSAPGRERHAPPHPSVAHIWMAHKNGYDDLTPELQKGARAAYQRWQTQRTEAGKDPRAMDLRGYVSFVQERWKDDGRNVERKPIKGGKENKEVGRVVSRSVGMAGRGLGKALDALGGMVESLAAPPKPLTRAEREEAHRLHTVREAEADRQQIDLNKYLYDTDAERAAAIQKQHETQEKTQRENYERYGGRDRER
jgi:hypothetical protein